MPSPRIATDPAVVASVVVPARHRSAMLRETMPALLAQQLPGDQRFEVLLCLVAPADDADREECTELAAADPRVRVVEAPEAPGDAAARNAGIDAARGEVVAFVDDALADPGWLAAGLAAVIAGNDLVQGRTLPVAASFGWYRSTQIEDLTWRWEPCNLFVRRAAVDAVGLFDPSFGDDAAIEWGWRLVRTTGASYAFAGDAVVRHALEPRDFLGFLRDAACLERLPRLVRDVPEATRLTTGGRFLDPRHAVLVASLALGATAAVARRARAPRLARAAATLAALGLASPARRALPGATRDAAVRAATEAVQLGALAVGSVRHRRVLI